MDRPSTSGQADENKKCAICSVNVGIYTCPRCQSFICSVPCFQNQKHGNCSEQFYKECVQGELKLTEADSRARKRKMEEIVKLNSSCPEEYSDDDSDDDDDLAARLAGVDLDDSEALWNALTDKERQEYGELLKSTRITEILPEWNPWWIDGENAPTLASDIPSLASLTKTIPSPIMSFLVMNAIMAYQVSLRIIQGQSEVLTVEAASMISALSPPLRGSNQLCSSLKEAAELVVTELGKQSWGSKFPATYQSITEDLKDLTVVAPCNLLLALSHMKLIFKDAIEIIPATKNSPRFTGDAPKVSDLKKMEKKVIFYLSWAKQFDDSEWDNLVGNETLLITDD